MLDFLYFNDNWFEVATKLVGLAAIVATFTPTQTDNKYVNATGKLIHFLGMNFGFAGNKKRR